MMKETGLDIRKEITKEALEPWGKNQSSHPVSLELPL